MRRDAARALVVSWLLFGFGVVSWLLLGFSVMLMVVAVVSVVMMVMLTVVALLVVVVTTTVVALSMVVMMMTLLLLPPQSGLESPLNPLRPRLIRVARITGGLANLRPLPLERPFRNRSFWHNLAITAPHSVGGLARFSSTCNGFPQLRVAS